MSAASDPTFFQSLRSAVRHSVRAKLMLVILATTFMALLLTGAAMLMYDLRTYHQSWVNDMVAQAELIGRATAPALAFDDEKVANENLSLLNVRPKVEAAAVYNAAGVLFASYARAEGTPLALPQRPGADGYEVRGNRFILFKPIQSRNERLGTIYLVANYELRDRLESYLVILAAVMIMSLIAAVLMASWLQASITSPILAMTGVARQVMTQRDFTLSVRKSTDDEIGYLVDAFNAMLAQIDQQTKALESSNRTLHLEMGERRAAEQALMAADRQKDVFLATLAHELRNPLAPLMNALEILRKVGSDGKIAQSAREMMGRQLRQMVQLVNDLLDVSRISSGKLVLQKERVALADIVQTALEAAAPLIDVRKHHLNVSLPPQPVWLMADATRLAQVIVNLLNNAAKFTDAGGRLSFSAEERAGELTMTVADTGVGIPEHLLSAIFDMFTQADRSLDRPNAGLGVGLSLSRYLVEAHGGSIVATSAGHGKGSTFTVRLGTIISESQPGASLSPQESSSDRRLRILVADDNVDFAASLAMLLESLGHEVLVANDGQRALEIAPAFHPNICFLDIGLPRVHGYELAMRLREHPATRQAILVAVSGWGQEDDKRRSQAAGFDQHFVKPVDFEVISNLVNELASGHAIA